MREIVTTTGASLFTAVMIIVQAAVAPAPAHTATLTHATIPAVAR